MVYDNAGCSSENTMAIESATIIRDVLFFIKNDLDGEITDPVISSRPSGSKFIMTSYPQRMVFYPHVTLRVTNVEALRAGMQSTAMDYTFTIELRVWARNQKEKDEIYTAVLDRLRTIQFTNSTGSIANNLHDFNALSAVEVDEEGKGKPKSRICEIQYKFFN